MKKLYIIAAIALLCNSCGSNIPLILKQEFQKVLSDNYHQDSLQKTHNVLDSLWSNMYWIDHDVEHLIKQTHVKHPYYLANFKHTRLYRRNISKLLHADNPNQRLVAHKLIEYTKDYKYADTLLETIKHENNDDVRYYNILSIASLCPKETDLVFDYIVKNIQLKPYQYEYIHNVRNSYLGMDTSNQIRTAYSNLQDSNINGQVLAIYSISTLDTSNKPTAYIIKALNNWDDSVKAYAFAALATHKKKNLKPYLQPYAHNPKLRLYVIQALKKSNSIQDIQFADSLILSKKH